MMLIYCCLIPTTTIAQTVKQPQPDNTPLEVKLLNAQNNQKNVITINSVNQKQLTVPSLWWLQEEFGVNLLNYWLAYPQQRRIDIVVNRTRWNALNYMDKYSFVHRFGYKIAQKYGYNTRIFIINQPQKPIGAYTCNLDNNLSDCRIIIHHGKEGLRLPRN